MSQHKILTIDDLAVELEKRRNAGDDVVLCHGCFDLLHPGHIKYLQASRQMGDVLVVTLSPDQYVDKGPGRPAFSENLRAESLAALECVDYVSINQWPTAVETLKLLRPAIYVKGQEFKDLKDSTGKIQQEYEAAEQVGTQVRFTNEVVFSSTALLNSYFRIPE